ncbi:hypothetical protein SLS57_012413 [Botryosphaeria dothidea]
METRMRFIISNAFALTQSHLDDHDQLELSRHLENTAMGAFDSGSSVVKHNMLRIMHARTDMDEERRFAHVIRLLVSAILEHKAVDASEQSEQAARIVQATARPVVSCFIVMLDDVILQDAYQRSISRQARINRSDPTEPYPFYTTPFVRGRFADGGFDQARRLTKPLWSRVTGSALFFPYKFDMTDANWQDQGTVATLNRTWGYWMARNGYAADGENLGPWSAVERNYIVTLMEHNMNIHDLDVVDLLNEYLDGRTVEISGEEVEFKPRGVAGLRKMIKEEGIVPWREGIWSREFAEDAMRLEREMLRETRP